MQEWSNKARVEVAVNLARDDAGRNRRVVIDKSPDTYEVGDSWDDPDAGVWVAAWVWVGVDDIHDALERAVPLRTPQPDNPTGA